MASKMSDIDQNAVQIFQDASIKPEWSKTFPVIGKGTFLFNIKRTTPFYIIVRGQTLKCDAESWIGLTVTKKRVSFMDKIQSDNPKTLCETTTHGFFGNNVGLEPSMICTYWLSYDTDRMRIKYGKGYRMEKTTILEHDFGNLEKDEREKIRQIFFDSAADRYVELYDENLLKSPSSAAPEEIERYVNFDPIPLVSDLSYIVKDSSSVNLFDLDSGKYMYSASLPVECQMLYANIKGDHIDLDYVDSDPNHQYDFKLRDAIRYSIETKGCTLYEKLQSKVRQFGELTQTYLRIALGKYHGNSPGIPYVLELWPKKHGSPIHNHDNAYAVIRVIYGGLTILYYNKVSEGINSNDKKEGEGAHELGKFDVKEGDVTWISPNWYQTHKLWNGTDDYCATIQCYKYGNNDYMNRACFDYISNCGIIEEFRPDSDYNFTEMYNRVMKEYADRPAS